MAGEKFTVSLVANVKNFINNLKKATKSAKSMGMQNRGIVKGFQQMTSATSVVGKRFFQTTQKMKSGVTSIGRATNGLSKSINKKLNPTLKKTTKETDKGTKSWKKYFKIIGVGIATIGSLVGSFFALKKVIDLVEQGAAFQVQAKAFNNLVASQGVNAEKLVTQLKEVSKNTIDTLSLITTATRAILLGIPAGKLVQLMDVARRASKAMGTEVAGAFSDIALGIGRQSRLILDNLGIIVRVGVAYENYARLIGTTASALTDFEKRQAFLNEALRIGQENLKNSSKNITDFRDRLDQLRAALKDAGKRLTLTLLIPMLALVEILEERGIAGKFKEFFEVTFPAQLTSALESFNLALETTLRLFKEFKQSREKKKDQTGFDIFADMIDRLGLFRKTNKSLVDAVSKTVDQTFGTNFDEPVSPKSFEGFQASSADKFFKGGKPSGISSFLSDLNKKITEIQEKFGGLSDSLFGAGGETRSPFELASTQVKALTIAAEDTITKAGDIQKQFSLGVDVIKLGVINLDKQFETGKKLKVDAVILNGILRRRKNLFTELVKLKEIQLDVVQEEAFLESQGLKSDRRRRSNAKQDIAKVERLIAKFDSGVFVDPIQLIAAKDKLLKPILEIFESLPSELQSRVFVINEFFEKNIIPPDSLKRGLNQWVDDFKRTKDRLTRIGISIGKSLTKGLDDTFFNIITGKLTDLQSVFRSFFNSLLRELTGFMAKSVVHSFLNLFGFGGTTTATQLPTKSGGTSPVSVFNPASTGPSKSATAGVFAGVKKFLGFAHGGITDLAGINNSAMITSRPTVAAISEKGQKEAIVPLDKFADLIRPTNINITAIDAQSFADFIEANKDIIASTVFGVKGSPNLSGLAASETAPI